MRGHPDRTVWADRRAPGFVTEWSRRRLAGPDEGDPVDYLAQDRAAEFAVASAWLFCPETVEYRGGIFLRKRFHPEAIDDWLRTTDLVATQSVVNSVRIWALFGDADSPAFEDESEFQLAAAIGECWDGVLARRYPDRDISVRVHLDVPEGSSTGPTVTFAVRDGRR